MQRSSLTAFHSLHVPYTVVVLLPVFSYLRHFKNLDWQIDWLISNDTCCHCSLRWGWQQVWCSRRLSSPYPHRLLSVIICNTDKFNIALTPGSKILAQSITVNQIVGLRVIYYDSANISGKECLSVCLSVCPDVRPCNSKPKVAGSSSSVHEIIINNWETECLQHREVSFFRLQ